MIAGPVVNHVQPKTQSTSAHSMQVIVYHQLLSPGSLRTPCRKFNHLHDRCATILLSAYLRQMAGIMMETSLSCYALLLDV